MIDHLTNALLAAARLDDAAAVAHLAEHLGAAGYGARKLLREFPVTLPAFLADRPSLRASVEREVARARECIAAGDVAAAVGVLLDHMEAML